MWSPKQNPPGTPITYWLFKSTSAVVFPNYNSLHSQTKHLLGFFVRVQRLYPSWGPGLLLFENLFRPFQAESIKPQLEGDGANQQLF